MLVEVKVPVLSESVADANLVGWHKKVGDYVRRDENLIEIETDKVVLEIPAPHEGVIKEIRKENGASVLSDEIIAVIDTEAQATTAVNAAGAKEDRPTAQVVALSSAEKQPERGSAKAQDSALSPAVRKLVEENNIDIAALHGSGKQGRITKEDVLRFLQSEPAVSASLGQTVSVSGSSSSTQKSVPQQTSSPVTSPLLTQSSGEGRNDSRVPMSRLRARIAERLKDAQNTAAILTTFNEVNMQPVMDMRARYQEQFTKKYDVKLGFMSFFVKAAIEALKKYPVINASVDGEDIIYHDYYDIGIAVSSPRGLVVPVLRDVDKQSFAGIEASIIQYGKAAKAGTLGMDDLMGGTFTITNGGVFGSLLSTPILNPPQSAILGMHSIQQRPVAEDGEVVIRPVMNLALSYDHRIIDGHEAVLFLVSIKQALEDPSRMLLQI